MPKLSLSQYLFIFDTLDLRDSKEGREVLDKAFEDLLAVERENHTKAEAKEAERAAELAANRLKYPAAPADFAGYVVEYHALRLGTVETITYTTAMDVGDACHGEEWDAFPTPVEFAQDVFHIFGDTVETVKNVYGALLWENPEFDEMIDY